MAIIKNKIILLFLLIGSIELVAIDDIGISRKEKMGSTTPQMLHMYAGMEEYGGVNGLYLDSNNLPLLIATDFKPQRRTYAIDDELEFVIINDNKQYYDNTFFQTNGKDMFLSGNFQEKKLQLFDFNNKEYKVLIVDVNTTYLGYKDGDVNGLKPIPQANGNCIFLAIGNKKKRRALFSCNENTISPLFPIDTETDFLQFIDEYGYHYFSDKVLDINGNYVARLVWPDSDIMPEWNSQYARIQGGMSDNFFYSFVKTEDIITKDDENMHVSWDYETGILLYSIFRSEDYWEIIFEGVTPINHTTVAGIFEGGRKIMPPLQNFTETNLPEFIYNNSLMDEEGRIYYMELDHDELRVMRITLDIDVKFINWARDGITEKQVTTPPGEITRYLEQATASELRRFRNTFFALDGYQFKSDDLTDYFSRYSWYEPSPNVKPDINALSDSQKRLLDLIQEYEEKLQG